MATLAELDAQGFSKFEICGEGRTSSEFVVAGTATIKGRPLFLTLPIKVGADGNAVPLSLRRSAVTFNGRAVRGSAEAVAEDLFDRMFALAAAWLRHDPGSDPRAEQPPAEDGARSIPTP